MKALKIFLPFIRIEYVWYLAVLGGIFAFVNTHPIRPHDFWWHLAIGREIINTGHIPTTDVYSFTAAGQPYAAYSVFWLAEAAMFLVYHWGGASWMVLSYSVILTTAYGLLMWLGRQVAGDGRAAAIGVFIAALLGVSDWNLRPQGLAFLWGAMLLVSVYQIQKTRAKRWVLCAMAVVSLWTNTHGTFLLALLILGAWVADEIWNSVWPLAPQSEWVSRLRQTTQLKWAGATLGLAGLACLLNPRGFGVFSYLQNMALNPTVQRLATEWAPPTFDTLQGQLFFGGLFVIFTLLMISPKRPSIFQLALCLGLAALGSKTSRGSVWLGIVAAPIVAEHLAALLSQFPASKPAPQRPHITALVGGLILVLAGFSLPWFKAYWPLPSAKAGVIALDETPLAAVEYLLANQPAGPLFHTMSFGSYLIWAAQPEYKVFVDSRIELYPLAVWQDYLYITNALPEWDARLQSYGAKALLLSQIEQPGLIAAATASPGWRRVYQDEVAVIFIRR